MEWVGDFSLLNQRLGDVDQIGVSWNHVASWLRPIAALRAAADAIASAV